MGMSENLLLQKGVMVKIVMLRKQGPQKKKELKNQWALKDQGAEPFGVKQKAF